MLISGGVPADGETFPSRVPSASTIFTWISLRTRASRTFPPPREIRRLRKFHQTSRFLWFWVVTRAKKKKDRKKKREVWDDNKDGGRSSVDESKQGRGSNGRVARQ